MKTFNATVVRQVVTQEDRCHKDCFFLWNRTGFIPLCELYGKALEFTGLPFRCEECLKDHNDKGKWADRFKE
jgi:hypothetical protein